MKTRFIFLLIITTFLGCQKKSEQNKILVFAAVSLSEVLQDIEKQFEQEHNVDVQFNFASSGTLARQIEQGVKVDVFISANKKWTNYLDSIGVITNKTNSIANNSLVFITPKSSDVALKDIANKERMINTLKGAKLAIGDPAHVPAGMYAKEVLEYFDWYKYLSSNLLFTKDVRTVLSYVELNEALLGIVYKTDALASSKVKVLSDISNLIHSPINYEAVICNSNQQETNTFFNYLSSPKTAPIWKKYGFKR